MTEEKTKKKTKPIGTKEKGRRDWGGLEKRPSGRWRGRFKGPDGKIYRSTTFKEKESAKAWLNRHEVEIGRALANNVAWVSPTEKEKQKERNSTTVRELIEAWLADEQALPKLSTRQSHRRHLNPRVLCDSFPGFDSLADERLVDVDLDRIELWWEQVEANWPDMPDANQKAYKRLHTAFNYAIKKTKQTGITENPVKVAGANKRVRTKVQDRDLLELEEAAVMVEAISPRLKAPLLILQWAGLRLGELLALRRMDITDNGKIMAIHVTRNAQRIKDETTSKQKMKYFDTPKTEAGNRKIVLPGKVAEKVRAHLATYVEPEPDALIVTTEKGQPMMDTNFRSRFKFAAKKAGRPELSPHDFRRFFGTMLVTDSGVNLEAARVIMGHESKEQLLEYMRKKSKDEETAASNFDRLIS